MQMSHIQQALGSHIKFILDQTLLFISYWHALSLNIKEAQFIVKK